MADLSSAKQMKLLLRNHSGFFYVHYLYALTFMQLGHDASSSYIVDNKRMTNLAECKAV